MIRRIAPLLAGIALAAAARAEDPARATLESLRGTWKPGPIETQRGVKGPAADNVVTIRDDRWILTSESRGLAGELVLRVDPDATPPRIDWLKPDGSPFRIGVYRLEGNTLTTCTVPPGEARPTSFDLQAGARRELATFTRRPPADAGAKP